jgi:UDP:flavonoid glycosyltransferase YjiC (YdhE family)
MKAVIAANGLRGDLQPMLVLARAMRRLGHDVMLCGTPGYAALAEELGIPFQPCGLDVPSVVQAHKDMHASSAKMITKMWRFRTEEMHSQFAAVEQAAAGADLVVSAGTQFAAGSIASKIGAAHVAVFYVPTTLPSASHAPLLVPWFDLPPPVNRLLWKWDAWFTMAMLGGSLNHHRRQLGLPPARMFHDAYGPQHWLLAADPELCPLPDDLRGRCTQTAAITRSDGELPPEVDAFIRAGSPPIYIGFGSIVERDAARTTRLLLDAIHAAGVRALLARGPAHLGDHGVPPSCMVVGPLPHHAVLPRMAAVVHHGGAGTTAAATRAGVPQIVVPHIVDQFYFAHRVQTLGLGPPPIPHPKLTAARLAAALTLALTSEPMQQRARAMAERLAVRDGLGETVALLERLCHPAGRASS